jgi:hypothetical protein
MEFAPESNRVVHIKVLNLGMPKWDIAIHGNSNRTDPDGRRKHHFASDEPVEAGGTDTGPGPSRGCEA